MDLKARAIQDISWDLVESLRRFPVERQAEHCGLQWTVRALEMYSNCPKCGTRIKLRSFSGVAGIEDVFDAVLEWMSQPAAEEIARQRQQAIAEDAD